MNNKTYREQEQKQGMTPSSEPNNLLSNIEKIIELSENSGLGDEFFENAKPYIDFVKNELQLSDMATVFFAFLVDNNDSNYTSINDLSEHFNCRKVRIMRYGESLQELEKKRLVRCHRGSGAIGYQVRKEVMFALNEGEKIERH